MALISVHDLTVDTRVKHASLELHRCEMLGLIGPNGAGKSTLLNAIAGVIESEGKIHVEDKDVQVLDSKHRARLIGLQPQSVESAWSIDVNDVVELGRIPWGDSDQNAIQQAIKWTDIEAFTHRRINELSGGERARVWLARVLAGRPQVLLVDEPIANLDIHYQLSVMNVLWNYAQNNHGVIVAIHDLSLAARYCDRLCLMHKGNIIAIGNPEKVLNEEILSDTYGIPVHVNLKHQPPIVIPG